MCDKTSISRTIIKPKDCILFFGLNIPEGAAEFHAALNEMDESRWLKENFGSGAGWLRFCDQLGEHFHEALPHYHNLGLTIRQNGTWDEFSCILNEQRFNVLILFSHWREMGREGVSSVEFSDGFAPVTKLVQALPEGQGFILDLCVCHPADLVELIRTKRTLSEILIKHSSGSVTPRLWIYFYHILMMMLRDHDICYQEAWEMTRNQFVNGKYQTAKRMTRVRRSQSHPRARREPHEHRNY
jgi:hypothetical protein